MDAGGRGGRGGRGGGRGGNSMDPRRLLLSVLGEETDCEVVDYVIGSIEGTDEEAIDELVELLTAHSMTDPSEESVRAIATQVAAMVTAQPAAVAAAPLEPAAPPLAAPPNFVLCVSGLCVRLSCVWGFWGVLAFCCFWFCCSEVFL